MKTISYVFIKGRKNYFESNLIEAKEFYYGLTYFYELGHRIQIIEFNKIDSIFNKILIIFDKLLNKFLSIPSYTHKIISITNFKKLLKSDNVILVSESTGFSTIFILFFLKLKKSRTSLFVMGMYSKSLKYKKLQLFHNAYIKILVFLLDDIFILGKGEFLKAVKLHKNSKKLFYFPFCIDTDFWVNNEEKEIFLNNEILFVGNDGNRDFELLEIITKKLPHLNFRLISENEIVLNTNSNNTKVHKGSWGSRSLSDTELRNFYLNSKFVIIPLKESLQPSGQSVALQAMSLGVPVIISKTEGFWDNEMYEDNKSIFFVEPNEIDNWIEIISKLYYDDSLTKKVGLASKEIVNRHFSLKEFNKMLSNILEI